MFKQIALPYFLLPLLLALLFMGGLVYGAVSIPLESVIDILLGKDVGRPAWQNIILQSRFPQAVTALLAGASLATSGLLLQTLFRNPLAGPSILGISDGANLGVAAIMLYFGGTLSMVTELPISGYLAVIIAAFAGAACILGLIIWFSAKVKSNVMLLIIGIMIGYLASSLISVLNYYASTDKVHAFVMWGLGNFSGVSLMQLPYFLLFTLTGLLLAILLIKPLNALLLGEMYAANLGIKIKRTRIAILFCTGLLTATTTAFCGPISFIGLAVPHIARLMLGSSNHKMLVPVTMLAGSCIALLCNILMVMPGTNNSTDEYARTCNRSQQPQYWLPAERRKAQGHPRRPEPAPATGRSHLPSRTERCRKVNVAAHALRFPASLERRDPPDGKTVVFLLSKQLFTDGRCCTDGKDECGRHHRLRTGVFGPSSVHRFLRTVEENRQGDYRTIADGSRHCP